MVVLVAHASSEVIWLNGLKVNRWLGVTMIGDGGIGYLTTKLGGGGAYRKGGLYFHGGLYWERPQLSVWMHCRGGGGQTECCGNGGMNFSGVFPVIVPRENIAPHYGIFSMIYVIWLPSWGAKYPPTFLFSGSFPFVPPRLRSQTGRRYVQTELNTPVTMNEPGSYNSTVNNNTTGGGGTTE